MRGLSTGSLGYEKNVTPQTEGYPTEVAFLVPEASSR